MRRSEIANLLLVECARSQAHKGAENHLLVEPGKDGASQDTLEERDGGGVAGGRGRRLVSHIVREMLLLRVKCSVLRAHKHNKQHHVCQATGTPAARTRPTAAAAVAAAAHSPRIRPAAA